MTSELPVPGFGATVTNLLASTSSPRRIGYFVRVTRRAPEGPWWELTDGRGRFWPVLAASSMLVHPEDFPHLMVDRSTEVAPIEQSAVSS